MNIKLFKLLYPDTPNKELAKTFCLTEDAVKLRASRLGIKKSKTYVSTIQTIRATNRVLSQASKNKLSKARLGKSLSAETRSKISQSNQGKTKGDKHYKWKGGKPWERFKDTAYLQWRNSVLTRDNYTCQDCQKICKKYEKGLAAHHIKSYKDFPELRLDLDNGKTLCRECHMKLHLRPIKPKSKILCQCGCGTLIEAFDVYGRPKKYVNHHGKRGKRKQVQ